MSDAIKAALRDLRDAMVCGWIYPASYALGVHVLSAMAEQGTTRVSTTVRSLLGRTIISNSGEILAPELGAALNLRRPKTGQPEAIPGMYIQALQQLNYLRVLPNALTSADLDDAAHMHFTADPSLMAGRDWDMDDCIVYELGRAPLDCRITSGAKVTLNVD